MPLNTFEVTLMERARIQAKRVEELEKMVGEFIHCVEQADVQSMWIDGYIDLVYAYEEACGMLGRTPQSHVDPDDEEEDGYGDVEPDPLTYEQESFIP